MTDLFAARSQMAMSLGFHIVFAVVGMAMPLLMVIAEALALRTGDKAWLDLAKRWSKGTAITFAVGAVSGTVLSFELGLLWPGFMAYAGPIIGMPFSLEGFAFFLEAIFLGVYLYGWKRVPPLAHWLAGVGVLVSGTLSGVFVVCANAWMNTPTGFRLVDGVPVDIDPIAAMLNPAAPTQVLHMVVAAFEAVGFLVAGIHAAQLLRAPASLFHRRALAVALLVAVPSAFLQLASGHLVGEQVAHNQPVKLAAMEAHWETEAGAPFRIGGWPDEAAGETRWAIEIPKLGSLLAYGDPNAVMVGLNDVPADERPPVTVVHVAFQIMIAAGTWLAALAGVTALLASRRRGLPDQRPLLWALAASTPLGLVAIEAGWVVTEVGRQPWIVHGLMRTSDAVTPMPGLVVPFAIYTLVYIFLAVVVLVMLRRLVRESTESEQEVV